MILELILGAIHYIFQAINSMPTVSVLPFGIDSVLSMAVGLFKAFAVIFPPAGLVFGYFIIYLLFRAGLLAFKLIFGSRSPHFN